jgi:myo-inositol 2-dehydrogenase/D-chiro-inositol 1-dehydrogenase
MTPNATQSRRRFLQSAGAAASAAAALDIARCAHAAGPERLRVVLIGSGGRGAGAAADCLNVSKSVRLVAIADAFEKQARGALKRLQDARGEQVEVTDDRLFHGLDAYRKALAVEADLAILTTPPGFRPLHYRAAVEAGRHVFMEKPCCVDAGGFRSLQETNRLADQKKLKVGVGFYRRHFAHYQEAVARIHDGAIGKIQYLRCYCNMPAWGGFMRKADETEMMFQVRNWRVFDWLGGGRMVESHCHELDVMDWVMKGHPVEANGMGGRQVCVQPQYGQDYDHHFNEYLYADGTRMYSQCRQMNKTWTLISEHVHGAKEAVDLSGKVEINEFGRREAVNPYHKEHQALVEAIVSGAPYNEGWHGASSSFTGILGREASYCGEVVKWDLLAQKGRALFPEGELTWNTAPPVTPDDAGKYSHAVAMPGYYKPY